MVYVRLNPKTKCSQCGTAQRHTPRGLDWIGRVGLEIEGPKRDTSGKRYEMMIRLQEELTES